MNKVKIAAAALVVASTIAIAPPATAAPAYSDRWIAKQSLRMAWAEQSYSQRRDICRAYYIAPTYIANRLATATDDLNVSRTWARRMIMRFLSDRCSYIV